MGEGGFVSLSWAPRDPRRLPYTISVNVCVDKRRVTPARSPHCGTTSPVMGARGTVHCGCFFLHPPALRHSPLSRGSRHGSTEPLPGVPSVLQTQFRIQTGTGRGGGPRDCSEHPDGHWTAGPQVLTLAGTGSADTAVAKYGHSPRAPGNPMNEGTIDKHPPNRRGSASNGPECPFPISSWRCPNGMSPDGTKISQGMATSRLSEAAESRAEAQRPPSEDPGKGTSAFLESISTGF